jgi:hypothetical protein
MTYRSKVRILMADGVPCDTQLEVAQSIAGLNPPGKHVRHARRNRGARWLAKEIREIRRGSADGVEPVRPVDVLPVVTLLDGLNRNSVAALNELGFAVNYPAGDADAHVAGE